MIVAGIDPGIHGGLAIIAVEDDAAPRLVEAIDVPVIGTNAKERVDAIAIREWVSKHDVQHAFIERAQAMPKQGSSSGFKYGRAVGAIEATIALSGIPVTIVEPIGLETVLATPRQGQGKLAAAGSAVVSGRSCGARAQEGSWPRRGDVDRAVRSQVMNAPLEPQFGGRGVAGTLPFASSTAHHLFGASQARTRIGCPASAREIEKLPADMLGKTSSWAERGTACHTAIARLIENKCTLGDLIGTTIDSHTFTCDDCENAIRPAFEYAVAFLDTPGAEYFLEQRVSFPTIPGAFGTADLIVRIGDTIHIIDFKFGTGVLVRALYPDGDEDIVNSQILFYAVAAHHSLPDFFRGVEHIILRSFSRRRSDAEMVSSVEVTRAELDEFAAFYAAIYAEAMGPSPRLRKGPHCRFCPVRPICPEHTGRCSISPSSWCRRLPRRPRRTTYLQLLADGLNLVDAVKEIAQGAARSGQARPECRRPRSRLRAFGRPRRTALAR